MATRPKGSRFTFTDATVSALKPPPRLEGKPQQAVHTDAGCRGLSLVVGSGGAKAFRSQFRLFGKWQSRGLGRFGDFVDGADGRGVERITVDWARYQVGLDKNGALEGRDPRERGKRTAAASMTFKDVVTQYLAAMQDQQRSIMETRHAQRGLRTAALARDGQHRTPAHSADLGSPQACVTASAHGGGDLGAAEVAVEVGAQTRLRERHDGGAVLREHAHRQGA